MNPYMPEAGSTASGSSLLSEADFKEIYSATEFAWQYQLFFETSVTIAWSKLGLSDPAEIQRHFTDFLKAVRTWLAAAKYPPAFIYVHEVGPRVGLHTHFVLALPAPPRGSPVWGRHSGRIEFKHWLRGWRDRRYGRNIPRAFRVRGPNNSTPWLHWLQFNYLCKGFDQSVVVQSGRNSPDGRAVMLGDLLLTKWSDPGIVRLNRRFGISHGLGPDRRALGAPGGLDYLFRREIVDPFQAGGPASLAEVPSPASRIGPFRSSYEDGIRDIRVLYPAEFWNRVRILLR